MQTKTTKNQNLNFSKHSLDKGIFCEEHLLFSSRTSPGSCFFCECGRVSFLRILVNKSTFCPCRRIVTEQDNFGGVPNVRRTDKLSFTLSSGNIGSASDNQSELKTQNDRDKAAKSISGYSSDYRSVSEENLPDGVAWTNSVFSLSTSQSDLLRDAGLLIEHTDFSVLTLLEVADAALEPTDVREPVVTDTNFSLPVHNFEGSVGRPET